MPSRRARQPKHHRREKEMRRVRKQIKRNRKPKRPRRPNWMPDSFDNLDEIFEFPQSERIMPRGERERREHVMMKAFLWALYLPAYPDLVVETRVGDHYKPDVVALDAQGRPPFWGEAGHVGVDKIRSLARRYRDTHFAIAKWDTRLQPFVAIVTDALIGLSRSAPVALFNFLVDSAERFFDERGYIRLTHAHLEWTQVW